MRRVAATASLAALLRLPPAQRSSVVLMDVLGHPRRKTGRDHRRQPAGGEGRPARGPARIAGARRHPRSPGADAGAGGQRDRLRAYADRFNARDFDALRDLLAEDVRLDLPNQIRLAGRKE